MSSLLGNVGKNLLGFFAGKAAAALTGILLLRALQPEAAGVYGAALGFAALFQSVADLGLSTSVTRIVGARPAQASAVLSRALVAQALQVLVAGAALAVFVRLGGAGPVDGALVMLAYGFTAFNSLAAPVAAVLQGIERFGRLGVLTTAASLCNAAALAAVLIWGRVDPASALLASLGGAAAGILVWGGGAISAGLRWRSVRASQVWSLWRQSLPFAMVSVTTQLYVRIDLSMLAWLLGTGPLGLYLAAARLVDLLVPTLGALNGPLYARLAGLQHRAGRGDASAGAEARANLGRALRAMAALCLPLGVGGSVLARPLLSALYGEGFAAGAEALAWLVWVPALIGIHSSLLHALNASGRTLKLAQVFAFNLGLNVTLNLLFIPRFGVAGAGAVAVLCQSVNLAAAWLLTQRAGLAPSWRAVFLPALPAALAMGLAVAYLARILPAWPLGLRLPALIAAGMLVYAALLGLLGFVGQDERAIWHRLRGRA